MSKKGQIEIADVFAFLIFAVIALIAFGLLSFAETAEKQEILSELGDTTVDEALISLLKMPTGDFSNLADDIVESVNNKEFSKFNENIFSNFDKSFKWILVVFDSDGNQLFEINSFDNDGDYTVYSTREPVVAEQFIPNPHKLKSLKVNLHKIDEGVRK